MSEQLPHVGYCNCGAILAPCHVSEAFEWAKRHLGHGGVETQSAARAVAPVPSSSTREANNHE